MWCTAKFQPELLAICESLGFALRVGSQDCGIEIRILVVTRSGLSTNNLEGPMVLVEAISLPILGSTCTLLGRTGGGSDYKPPPPQTSPDQNKRGAPNQVREKLFGGAGPIPILRAINNLKP